MLDKKMYRETYSALHASSDTLTEVLNMTEKNNRTKKHILRPAIALAAALVLLSTTAFAYVGFTQYEHPGQMLSAFFGTNNHSSGSELDGYDEDGDYYHSPAFEREDVNEKVAEEISSDLSSAGTSIQYGGYTLTAEAVFYDAATRCGLFYFSLENPTGVTGYEVFDDGELWFNPESISINVILHSGEKYYIDEAQTTSNKLYGCGYFVLSSDEDDSQLNFLLWDYENKIKTESFVSLNAAQSMNTITLDGGNICISAISLVLSPELASQLGEKTVIIDDVTFVTLNYEDGSEYVVINKEEGSEWTENIAYALGFDNNGAVFLFNRLVDLDNVVSVTVNDTTYPVE